MSQFKFKFPIGARIARSLTEAPLLVVGHEILAVPNNSRFYWTIATSGVRDWEYADVLEAEFIELEN